MITSIHNPIINELKKQKNTLLFLDSPALIEEAIKSGIKPLYILVESGKQFNFLGSEAVLEVSPNIIDSLTDIKSSQGIIAVIDFPQKTLIPPTGNFLVLDNVQDAGNVGTLIRSALGANFNYVYLIDCAKLKNIKTIRSSMGAVFHINVFETSKQDFIKEFIGWNLVLYKTAMNGQNLFLEKPEVPCGIVVGNEGNGVSAEISKLCTHSLALPMNRKLESLNAGVSGSIIMYQIAYGGRNVRTQ